MAKQTNTQLFMNTDFSFYFTIYNAAETLIVDTSLWAMSWMLKTHALDADSAAVITKTTTAGSITVAGTYNSTPASNTQYINVVIADTDTEDLTPGLYVWELRRTDTGFDSVLAYGQLNLRVSVHGD